MVDRNYRLIIGRQLNPKLGPAGRGITLTRAARNNVLPRLTRAHAQLMALLQRGSDPGLALLEARAIDNLSQRGPGAGPAAATHGARSSSGRLQPGAAVLAAWDR
jgi:hypothetical protein